MSEMRKRAGVYGRQSHGKETSVEDQIREGIADCAELNADVLKKYRDRVSASRHTRKKREDWPLLLADVAAGELDLVWLWDASRGDRTPESWFGFLSLCRERGVLIHSKRDRRTYDVRIPRDWKTLAEDGVHNAYESEIKSVDVRRGISGAALAGKAHGPMPYGLARVYDRHDRRKFTQVPNEWAPVAREIIERVARQDPIIEIERDLNARDIPGPFGGRWGRWAVRKIARNPAYIGMRDHKGTLHPGNWDAIVPLSTWQEAQQVLDDPARKTTAPGSFKWLLSYLVATPCGETVNARPPRQGRKPRYRCVADGCTGVGVWEMDEYVARVMTAWFARKGARALFERADEDAEAARVELAKLNRELEEWRASADQPDGISAIALARKERSLLPLIDAEQKRIVSATAPAAAMSLLTAAEAGKKLIRPAWDGLSIAARRSVISAVTEEIRIAPADERLSRWSPDEDRLRLAAERTVITWVPRVAPER